LKIPYEKHPIELLSGNYIGLASANGEIEDAAKVARLKKIEGMVTDKVILNLWNNDHGNSTEILYFGKVDKKWYFLILDLTDFCDQE
jgi:hypothetical protein